MTRVRRSIITSLIVLLVVAAVLLAYAALRARPQDLPWTPLSLNAPVGIFTGRKLVSLGTDAARCHGLLDRAGVRFEVAPKVTGKEGCGFADGVRLRTGGAREIAYRPAKLSTSCRVAAGMVLWEWHVVQPAAQRHFGQSVASIDHLGSYSCRRMYGRADGNWSEHSTANAVDIAGFRLADGTRINVLEDWKGAAKKAAFLRDVRDGACGLFATTLSPDYNAAHRDHFHFDQANRGAMGWRACR